MTKTTKTLTLATTLLVAANTQAVKAEEAVTVETSQPQASQTVTAADVTTVTQEAKAAAEALATQETTLNEANEAYKGAQATHDKATADVVAAQDLVKTATPEAIEKVTTAIATAEAKLPNQEEAITQAQAEQDKAQADVTAQEQAVLDKAKALDDAQNTVNQAKASVDLAQANLDGTGAAAVIDEVKAATTNLTQAKDQLSQAQADLAAATQADQTRQAQLTDKETTLATLSAELGQQEANLATANSQLAQAKDRLAQAETALTKASNDYNAINTITLTPAYVADLKAFVSGGFVSDESTAAEQRLMAANKDLVALNTFKANPNDDQTKLDPNNLSQAVREELTLFAVDLVNQIRRQMGTAEVQAHHQVIDLAETIADGYEADNWDWNKSITVSPHDRDAIRTAAERAGLRSSTHYENIHTIGTMYQPISTLTMTELKQKVHQAVINFMFNGQEYFHAISVSATPGYGQTSRYMGLSFSNRSDAFSIHLIGVDEASITDTSRFDRSATLSSSADSAAIVAAYQAAQTAKNEAQTNLTQAQTTQATADLVVNTTKSQLNQIRQELASLSAQPLQVPAAQVKVNQATTALEQAEQRLSRAKIAQDNLTADVTTKKNILDAAKEALSQAQTAQADRNAELQAEQDKLQSIKATLSQKVAEVQAAKQVKTDNQEAIRQLKADLDKLLKAPEVLRQAKEQESLARTNLANLEQVWRQELAKRDNLKAVSDNLEAKRVAVVTAYDALLSAQEKERQEKEAARLSQTTRSQVYQAANPQANQLTYGKTTQTLPQTGDKPSMGLVSGSFLTILGLLGLRQKRRQ